MTDTIKLAVIGGISGLFAYLSPLHDAIRILLFLFFVDMIVAMIAEIIIQKKPFKPKKFMTAFIYVAIYLSIVASVYVIGEHMGDTEQALFVDKIVTYVFIYFYCASTLKNLRVIVPYNRPIAFLEFTLGLEFTKKIPNLDDFLRKEKEDKNKDEKCEQN